VRAATWACWLGGWRRPLAWIMLVVLAGYWQALPRGPGASILGLRFGSYSTAFFGGGMLFALAGITAIALLPKSTGPDP
jgi:hypothetical protein